MRQKGENVEQNNLKTFFIFIFHPLRKAKKRSRGIKIKNLFLTLPLRLLYTHEKKKMKKRRKIRLKR